MIGVSSMASSGGTFHLSLWPLHHLLQSFSFAGAELEWDGIMQALTVAQEAAVQMIERQRCASTSMPRASQTVATRPWGARGAV